jgi:hypothetical protein
MMKVKFLAAAVLFLFAAKSVSAQCINGTKSYPIYKAGAQLVNEFDNQEKEIVHIQYDLVFDSKETFRDLTTDWEYSIIAFADDGVKDIDLKVYIWDDLLEVWTLVAQDNSTESIAMITYQPEETARHKIEVIVYEFNESYTAARYGLFVVHD